MNEVATMPTRAATRPLKDCRTLEDAFGSGEFMARIRAGVPKHVSPDRMLRTFVMATSKTPDLLKCNLRSVLGAMLTCSQLGLEPNTALGHAYLIPFANRRWNPQTRQRELVGHDVQLILGYAGLMDLSFRSGMVKSIHCDVVWPGDDFSFVYGTDAHLKHIPRGRRDENAVPVWAYMHAQLEHGQAFEVMPYADVLKIRNQSQGFRAAQAAKEQAEAKGWKMPAAWADAPWVKHEIAMARKTALRAGSKWLPRSIEMAAALSLDERQDTQTLDFGAVIEGADVTATEIPAIEHEQTIDATAAFTDRRPEPEPAEPAARVQEEQGANENGHDTRSAPRQRRAAQTKPQPKPATEAREADPPPQQPREEPAQQREVQHFYLVDEAGELVEGDEGHTLDPVVFARRFVDRWTGSRQREALVEHNADGIADARGASRDATNILAEIEATEDGGAPQDEQPQDEQPPAAKPASLRVEVPKTGKGGPDLKGWLTAVQSSLQRDVHSVDQLASWMSANAAVYRDMPKATKAAFDTAYSGRRDQLLEASRGEKVAPPPSGDDDTWAAELIATKISAAPTRAQLEADTGYQYVRERVAKLEHARPDLHQQIRAAYLARLEHFTAQASGAP